MLDFILSSLSYLLQAVFAAGLIWFAITYSTCYVTAYVSSVRYRPTVNSCRRKWHGEGECSTTTFRNTGCYYN